MGAGAALFPKVKPPGAGAGVSGVDAVEAGAGVPPKEKEEAVASEAGFDGLPPNEKGAAGVTAVPASVGAGVGVLPPKLNEGAEFPPGAGVVAPKVKPPPAAGAAVVAFEKLKPPPPLGAGAGVAPKLKDIVLTLDEFTDSSMSSRDRKGD